MSMASQACVGPVLPLLLDRVEEETSPTKCRIQREKLVGTSSDILPKGAHDAACVRDCMPQRFRSMDWELAYSARRHGLSMNTFFHRVAGKRDTVLLIKDDLGHVFGGYIAGPWKNCGRFSGTGESFVFQLCPDKAKYSWTGENSMFVMSDMTGIVIGGGGAASIWVDGDFHHGGSGECQTFGSPCLASRELFTCIDLEVWVVFDDFNFSVDSTIDREELPSLARRTSLRASSQLSAEHCREVVGMSRRKKSRSSIKTTEGQGTLIDGGLRFAVCDEALARLLQMEFEHDACLAALRATWNDVGAAAQWLLRGEHEVPAGDAMQNQAGGGSVSRIVLCVLEIVNASALFQELSLVVRVASKAGEPLYTLIKMPLPSPTSKSRMQFHLQRELSVPNEASTAVFFELWHVAGGKAAIKYWATIDYPSMLAEGPRSLSVYKAPCEYRAERQKPIVKKNSRLDVTLMA